MAEITHSPVLQALERLSTRSADEEAQRLAFVLERAVADEAAALRYAINKGRQEGRQEGLQEAAANVLQRLLTHKFGALPDALLRRLSSAPTIDLEAWVMKALDARSMDEVFGPLADDHT